MYQKNKDSKKQIDFEKYKLFEIPFSKVKFENDKSLFICIDEDAEEGFFINKKSCYKSKKYEYKQVFLIKIFEEMMYEVRSTGDWECILVNFIGKELIKKLEKLENNEEY